MKKLCRASAGDHNAAKFIGPGMIRIVIKWRESYSPRRITDRDRPEREINFWSGEFYYLRSRCHKWLLTAALGLEEALLYRRIM